MNKLFKKLDDNIKKYKKIVIYRHKSPDGDALGSQFALANFIKLNYENKIVYTLESADDVREQEYLNLLFPKNKIISKINDALIIVLDTSTKDRVSGTLEGKNNYIFKIDHHPTMDKYYDQEIQNTSFSSTCEIIAQFVFSKKDFVINKKIAEYLFIGLITDTGRFLFPSVTPKTFEIAGKLLKYKIETKKIYNALNFLKIKVWKFQAYIVQNSSIKNQIAWFLDEKEIYKEYKLSFQEAGSLVNTLIQSSEIKYAVYGIWNKELGFFKVSLRSKEKPINKIAEKWGGGGHSLASGVKIYNKDDFYKLIKNIESL